MLLSPVAIPCELFQLSVTRPLEDDILSGYNECKCRQCRRSADSGNEVHMQPLTLEAQKVPLINSAEGTIFIAGTRVPLDTFVGLFQQGNSVEQFVEDFPTVSLSDAYAVAAYYLSHQKEVDAYLSQQRKKSSEVQENNEVRFPGEGVRDRLIARSSSSRDA